MVFSTILFTIQTIKKEQKNAGVSQKYEVQLSDIVSDFRAMKTFYSSAFENAPMGLKMEFAKEVKEFYLVVDKLYVNENNLTEEENETLGNIYLETKKIKEKLSAFLSSSATQRT